jgi:hypothetical protein
MNPAWPWVVLALLGAYHGLNPAMGWLFALSLGLQEKKRSAVLRSLLPIAVGHAVSIAATIFLLHFAQQFIPMRSLKSGVAAILFALGIFRLFRASHPRGAGMRVGGWDLAVWSFLMSSAHGAGLMLMPVLMAHPTMGMSHSMAGMMMSTGSPELGVKVILLAVLVHTVAMLIVAGILAIAFFESYERSGLNLLRHAWFNFDLLWAVALIVAAVAALMM